MGQEGDQIEFQKDDVTKRDMVHHHSTLTDGRGRSRERSKSSILLDRPHRRSLPKDTSSPLKMEKDEPGQSGPYGLSGVSQGGGCAWAPGWGSEEGPKRVLRGVSTREGPSEGTKSSTSVEVNG